LNIIRESSTVNPDEEVIRKRGRKKTPKVSLLPLRRSPRKLNSNSNNSNDSSMNISFDLSESLTSSPDQTHDYFLRTPKKAMTSPTATRTVPKLLLSPTKTSTPMTPTRVSPRKRLLLSSNDSGIELSPALSGHQLTPNTKSNSKIAKTQTKSSTLTKRRRRRYF